MKESNFYPLGQPDRWLTLRFWAYSEIIKEREDCLRFDGIGDILSPISRGMTMVMDSAVMDAAPLFVDPKRALIYGFMAAAAAILYIIDHRSKTHQPSPKEKKVKGITDVPFVPTQIELYQEEQKKLKAERRKAKKAEKNPKRPAKKKEPRQYDHLTVVK